MEFGFKGCSRRPDCALVGFADERTHILLVEINTAERNGQQEQCERQYVSRKSCAVNPRHFEAV